MLKNPVELTRQEAEKIIYKALHVHRHVFLVMQNRYPPPLAWLKELVDGGKPGKIFVVQLNCYCNCNDRYHKADSWHGKKDLDGSHTVYPVRPRYRYFILDIWHMTDIQSKLASRNHHTGFDDSGLVHFNLINGGSGCINFSASVWHKNLESSLTIIAENGSVKVGA